MNPSEGEELKEIRCNNCNEVLAYMTKVNGVFDIICPHCNGTLYYFLSSDPDADYYSTHMIIYTGE